MLIIFVFVLVMIIAMAHSTTQHSSVNLPPYPPNDHNCSKLRYCLLEGRRWFR